MTLSSIVARFVKRSKTRKQWRAAANSSTPADTSNVANVLLWLLATTFYNRLSELISTNCFSADSQLTPFFLSFSLGSDERKGTQSFFSFSKTFIDFTRRQLLLVFLAVT